MSFRIYDFENVLIPGYNYVKVRAYRRDDTSKSMQEEVCRLLFVKTSPKMSIGFDSVKFEDSKLWQVHDVEPVELTEGMLTKDFEFVRSKAGEAFDLFTLNINHTTSLSLQQMEVMEETDIQKRFRIILSQKVSGPSTERQYIAAGHVMNYLHELQNFYLSFTNKFLKWAN